MGEREDASAARAPETKPLDPKPNSDESRPCAVGQAAVAAELARDVLISVYMRVHIIYA